MDIRYRYAAVQGHRVFYREAGPTDAPVIVLLHGFPSSSHRAVGAWPRVRDAGPSGDRHHGARRR
jgi:pimeloyl-ACP methyl ester carboxylesterase